MRGRERPENAMRRRRASARRSDWPIGSGPAQAAPLVPALTQLANPSAELTRDGAALHFPAARGRASVIFVRGDVVWIVLDGHPALDTASMLAPLASILTRAQGEQTAGALV